MCGAKQLGVLRNFDPPKIGKQFCASEIISDDTIAFLWSGILPRLSIDQKANLKVGII